MSKRPASRSWWRRPAVAGLLLTGLAPDAASQDVDLAGLDALREPRVTERGPETVLQVRAVGDPAVMGGSAFGLLFQLYYTSPTTPKAPPGPVVKARWPSPAGTPRDEWVGLYALPVPDGTEVPPHQAPAGLEAVVTTWHYDAVAEVLYVGPYDREQPALDSLRAFAEASGYEVLPGHEEEYIRGPTMSGPGKPEEYLTLLRYRVRRPDAETSGVRGARQASNAAIAAHDLDGVVAFWTDDIAMTAGSGTSAVGRATWRELLAAQFERYPDVVYVRTPDEIEISRVAPLAAERGRWVGRWTAEAGPVETGGHYAAMWRLDGERWLIRSQLFVTLWCRGDGCETTRTP